MIKNITTVGNLKVTTIEIKNNTYRSFKDRARDPNMNSIEATDEAWFVLKPNFTNKMSQKLFDELSNHPLVSPKTFGYYTGITSFSFTRKAFYDKAWDDINIKARGLFVNNDTLEIVARSYEKFFNLGENDKHTKEALEKSLTFPVTAFLKENGFLGIVGYDSQTDQLFISSKSTPEGEFADNFRRIFYSTFNLTKQQEIKVLLRDQEASLIFEVNDPVNDPHMIEYDKEHLVLLDIVGRSENFQSATYDQLRAFANKFQMNFKKKIAVFENWQKLSAWINNIEKDSVLEDAKNKIEGWVLQDAADFQFKIKTNYYSHWKYMRSIKDRKAKSLDGGKVFEKNIPNSNDLILKFAEWIDTKDLAYLQQDIIKIRRDFLQEVKVD